MSGRLKNHTLKGSTSLYSLCMEYPPPRERNGLMVVVYNDIVQDSTVAHFSVE